MSENQVDFIDKIAPQDLFRLASRNKPSKALRGSFAIAVL